MLRLVKMIRLLGCEEKVYAKSTFTDYSLIVTYLSEFCLDLKVVEIGSLL